MQASAASRRSVPKPLRLAVERFDDLNEKLWFRLLISIAVSVIVVGYMCLSDKIDAFDDDWAISVALSGRYPDSGLSLFVNAFISNITLPLNEMMPFANWFLVIEHVVILIAFTSIVYVILTYITPSLGFLIIAGCIYFLIPYVTYYSNFTFVSATCSIAGFFMLIANLGSNRHSWPLSIMGMIFCVLGFMFRMNMFLLSLPFAFIAFIFVLIWKRKQLMGEGNASWMKALLAPLIPIIAAFALCGVAYAYDSYAWSQPGWDEWSEWNDYRSDISDYGMPPYSEVKDELAPYGITENAYYLANAWAAGDVEFFDLERMGAIASVSEVKSLSSTVQNAFTYLPHINLRDRAFFYCLLMLVLSLLLSPKRARIPLILVALVTICAASYFYGLGRLLVRIEHPIYLYSVFAMALLVAKGRKASEGGWRAAFEAVMPAVSAGCLLIVTVYMALMLAPTLDPGEALETFDQEDAKPKGDLYDFASVDDGHIYVWGTLDFVDLEGCFRHKFLPSSEFLDRNICIGGWSTNSPYINARNDEVGMTNVVKGLVDNPRARFISEDDELIQHLYGFIREEYYPDAKLSVVEELEAEVRDVGTFTYKICEFSAN